MLNCLLILAQVSMPDPSFNWTGLIGQFGVGGILVWYLYHTQSKTIPELIKAHTDSIADQRREYTASFDKARVDYLDMTQKLQDKYINSIATITMQFREDLKIEREFRQAEFESVRNAFKCGKEP